MIYNTYYNSDAVWDYFELLRSKQNGIIQWQDSDEKLCILAVTDFHGTISSRQTRTEVIFD